MTIEYIVKLLDGAYIGNNIKREFNGNFKIDSREIEEGDSFICINSGIDFVEDAIDRRASLIISEKSINTSVDTIIVTDTKKALITLGSYIRQKYLNIPLIGITGSVGKTTTKELISSILETKYKVLKSSGNNNNLIGIPKTIFKLDNSYDICVFEFGMNHSGEISTLSKMCLPDRAVITNIGTSHIGYLKNKRNILKAKSEVLDGMPGGVLYINGDDDYLNKIKYPNITRVGTSKKCKLKCSNVVTTKEHLYFNINLDSRTYNIVFNIPSKALIPNILLAIQIGLDFHIEIESIISKIKEYKPLKHRNEVLKLDNNITIIDDCYNACLESLASGLESLKHYKEEKIIIIGDILELGKSSKKIHKEVGKILSKIDGTIILVGDEVRYAYHNNFFLINNNDEVIDILNNIDLNNKVIYLKGSRGMKLEGIKEYIEKSIS